MLGFNHLPNKSENMQIFYTIGSGVWQTWEKPPFAQNVYIFCIGGGSGGKAGNGGSAGVTRTGGGGGASAGYSFGTFSANLLPDVLYVSVGPGGAGGAGVAGGTGGAGSAGTLSYVSAAPNTTTQNIVLASGAAAPTGPTTPTGGTGGTAWSFTTNYVIPYLGLVIVDNAGQNGGTGNAGAGVGGDVTPAGIASGGAGGAGVGSTTGFAGGDILLSAFYADRPGGVAEGGDAPGGLNILPGTSNRNFIFFTGGSGGGSINNGVGGAGGNGGFGSGGGGGGAGTTGGRGGRGGDGLVIIVSW